jgi:hypothetical protein
MFLAIIESRVLRLSLMAAALSVWGCAAVHADRIATMRASGDHEQADCYQRCAYDDLPCLQRCDSAASAAALKENQQQFVQLAVAAAQVDAAKAAAKSQTAPAPPATADGSGSPETRPAMANGTAPAPAPSASTDRCGRCTAHGGTCTTWLPGSKKCEPGGQCREVATISYECTWTR